MNTSVAVEDAPAASVAQDVSPIPLLPMNDFAVIADDNEDLPL